MKINNIGYNHRHDADSIELYLKLFFIKLGEKLRAPQDSIISSHYDKMSIVRSKIYNMPQHSWNVEGLAHELIA